MYAAEAGTTLSRTPNAIDLPEDEWNEPRPQVRIQQREHEIPTGIVESEADGQTLSQESWERQLIDIDIYHDF